MPFGGLGSLFSLGAGAIGLGGALGGLIHGTPASNVPTFNYPGLPNAAYGATTGIGDLPNYNIGASNLQQVQNIGQQGVNNPYASSYLQGAKGTGALGEYAGGQLVGGALSTLPDAQALIAMGFDPQQALYNQTQNTNQQQNLATLAQSGVAGTPYGQGVEDQANNLFNINWQNNQLQRALSAGQGASGVQTAAAGNVGSGLNMMATGAGLPYNTFQGINTNQLGTLGTIASYGQQTGQIPQQQIQDYLAYLSGGTGQQNANTALAQAQFGQSQALGQGLGNSLAMLGKGFGNTGGGMNNWFGGGGGGTGGFATNQWAQANPGVAGSAYQGPQAA